MRERRAHLGDSLEARRADRQVAVLFLAKAERRQLRIALLVVCARSPKSRCDNTAGERDDRKNRELKKESGIGNCTVTEHCVGEVENDRESSDEGNSDWGNEQRADGDDQDVEGRELGAGVIPCDMDRGCDKGEVEQNLEVVECRSRRPL